MTKLLVLIGLFAAQLSFAKIDSITLSGEFENNRGCRVWNAHCMYFEGENHCSLEIYKDGEYVTSLGKGSKIESFNEKTINVKDFGLRSTHAPIPSYVNRKAVITIKGSYQDPDSYADRAVSKFDIKVSEGVMNKTVIECKDLKYVQ